MTEPALLPAQLRRRQHSAEFKAWIVAACQRPGVSIAAVARDNNLNDNLIHKWLRKADATNATVLPTNISRTNIELVKPVVPFIPVRVTDLTAAKEVIHLELRQQDLALSIDWPASQAAICMQFLQGLLR